MNHSHQENQQFFYQLLPAANKNNSIDFKYSILSKNLKPGTTTSDFISVRLLCTNRDLPYQSYHQDQNSLSLNENHLVRKGKLLKRPNLPYCFQQNS